MKKIIEFIVFAGFWIGLIVVFSTLASCRSKRIEHTIYKTDTIKTNTVLKITKPQLTNLTIDKPCDEYGNLKPFKYSFGTGKNKTTLKAVNDTIYLEQNIDSIVNSKIDTYKASSVKESAKTIRYKVPKWCWYNLIYSILATLFIFRKPLIKLIKPI
jgi:hypothetical protein